MFFAKLLQDLIPQAAVYHEAGERSRLINIFTHAYLSDLVPLEVPLWAWKKAISPNLRNCSQEIYIDSNNQLYAFLPLKPDLYPGLRLIHLVRDPREYVRSHLNWARHRLKSFVANYLTPFWQPNAWLLNQMSFGRWLQLSRFERYCWIWEFKNRFIHQMETSDIPYLRIRFEDFFESSEPLASLNQMLSFLDIDPVSGQEDRFQRPINPAKGRSFPRWPEWSSEQCLQLQEYCGLTMQEYGYGGEKDWVEKISFTKEYP